MGPFVYWEGGEPHWYYRLCWDSIKRHNPNAVLLNRVSAAEIIGTFPAELDDVYVVHRVDWIRKKVIETLGGVWIDMDFVCFQNLDWLNGLSRTWDYVGYREWPGNWMDNFFAGRKHSEVLAIAADYALGQVRQHGRDVRWLSTNAEAIEFAISMRQWRYILQLPTHVISPVTVMDPFWFAQDRRDEDYASFAAFGFITSFHGIGNWLRTMTEEEFLSGRSRLAGIVKRALE